MGLKISVSDFEKRVNNLLSHFNDTFILPNESIRLNQCQVVVAPSQFVRMHKNRLIGWDGSEKKVKPLIPYLERLEKLKNILIEK